jgi:hypothetical protein
MTILTGRIVEDGVEVLPANCSFWGHQEVTPRAFSDLHAVAMSATLFPRALFRRHAFDEALRFGSDEIDICAQAEQADYRIVHHPDLVIDHIRSPHGREGHEKLAEVSRLYATYKRYRWLERKPLKAMAFATLAPLHLLAGLAKHGRFAEVPIAIASIAEAMRCARIEGRRRRAAKSAPSHPSPMQRSASAPARMRPAVDSPESRSPGRDRRSNPEYRPNVAQHTGP